MPNILWIVGKDTDYYIHKTNSKKAPLWLKKTYKEFEDFINDDHEVPSDVAMAMYLAYHHPNDNIDCILAEDVTTKILNEYQVIFVIFDAVEVFHCGGREKTCPVDRKKFENMLRRTKAVVYPYPDFHKYIINKPSYYNDLKKAGLPIAPFFKITPQTALKNIDAFRNKIENKGWKGIIIKPSYAGYSLGIKVYKNFSRIKDTTLIKDFNHLKKYNFPNVTVQEFVPTFGDHAEIRTYWINEKYAYSVGTLTKKISGGYSGLPIDDEDTFVSEGGNIPDRIKRKLKILGKEAIKAILQYSGTHPFVRVDFGCCLTTNECDETYFINEVETGAANMLLDAVYDFSKRDMLPKMANAFYNFAKKASKNPSTYKKKGKKSKRKSRKKYPCVKP